MGTHKKIRLGSRDLIVQYVDFYSHPVSHMLTTAWPAVPDLRSDSEFVPGKSLQRNFSYQGKKQNTFFTGIVSNVEHLDILTRVHNYTYQEFVGSNKHWSSEFFML